MAELIARGLERLLAVAFILTVLLNFVNVVGRYWFDFSILGAEEIEVFVLVVIAFLGAIVVTLRDDHLKMDVLVNRLPPRLRGFARSAEWLVFALTAGCAAFYSFRYTSQMQMLGRRSDMTDIPVWIFHGSVTFAMGAMALIAALRFVGSLKAARPAS